MNLLYVVMGWACLGTFAILPSVYGQTQGSHAGIAPIITTPPRNLTNEYGSDVQFSVAAKGADVSYQWQKNGVNLHDYGNVIGAQSPNLALVGIAQSDVAKYSVVISNSVGAVTSSVVTLTVNASTIFSEDFESGLGNWSVFYDAKRLPSSTNTTSTRLSPSKAQNHTGGGSQSAMLNKSTDKMYYNFGRELYGRVMATFWIYDDGGDQTRYFGELRGYSGPGHTTYGGSGGAKQTFAIGVYNSAFATNSTGLLATEKTKAAKYQGKVDRGQNAGWLNLDGPGSPDRSVGWHKFQIERAADGTNVNFYVDGVLSRSVTGATYVALDSISIGSAGLGSVNGRAWFDDIKVEAWHKTFDWQSLESAGDGLPDWIKLKETGTNTLVTRVDTVAEINGAATNKTVGKWAAEGEGIATAESRGSLDYYVINVPVDDAYRLEIEARGRNARKLRIEEIPLLVSIDDEPLGRFLLPFDAQTNKFIHCFTPYLKAGPHTVHILWDNASIHNSLYIRSVRLQALAGPDSNGNGVKDWVENRLNTQNGTDFAPERSLVSPVCIEGKGQYLSMMSIEAGDAVPLNTIPVHPGAGDRWYANVPLSANGPTTLNVSYQNGGLKETGSIEWQETNLLEANNATIRKGDSLLLTALPPNATNGTITVTVEGGGSYTSEGGKPIAHRFDQAGSYAVTGTYYPGNLTKTITVKVVDADLGGPIAAWVGHRRFWDTTNLAPEIVIELDPRIQSAAVPEVPNRYSITNDSIEPRYVLARLGKKGPVVASAEIQGFRFFNDADSWLRLVQTYDDGAQLVEAGFILSPVLPNVTVQSQVIVSGVTFGDGTLNKTLTADDFDSLGICRVRFLRAKGVKTSVCHATRLYQGDELIGWPTYLK